MATAELTGSRKVKSQRNASAAQAKARPTQRSRPAKASAEEGRTKLTQSRTPTGNAVAKPGSKTAAKAISSQAPRPASAAARTRNAAANDVSARPTASHRSAKTPGKKSPSDRSAKSISKSISKSVAQAVAEVAQRTVAARNPTGSPLKPSSDRPPAMKASSDSGHALAPTKSIPLARLKSNTETTMIKPQAVPSPVTANPTGHRMVAQSTVSEEPRRDTLDLALQARARVWMQREVAFIDHPTFRQRDCESVDDVLAFAATVEDLPLQAELPDKLPPYLRRLCEVPLLTAEDERTLFRRMNFLKYQANVLRMRLREDSVRPADLDEIEQLVQAAEKIRNRIIRANMRLVMSIVKHYISDAMAFDDLLSEGAAALLRAAEKFDCSRGFRFSTYVTKVVRREVFRLVMAHKRQSDRYATGSWDFIGEQSEERVEEVDNEVDLSALRGDLSEFFANLDPREQAILRARFGMDHDDKAPSLNDLGRRMGVSKERVRQLEMRAIRKLQKQFQQRRAERREAAAV